MGMSEVEVAVVGTREAFELVGRRECKVGDRMLKSMPMPSAGKLLGRVNATGVLLKGVGLITKHVMTQGECFG